jgi:hypothetical protein
VVSDIPSVRIAPATAQVTEVHVTGWPIGGSDEAYLEKLVGSLVEAKGRGGGSRDRALVAENGGWTG